MKKALLSFCFAGCALLTILICHLGYLYTLLKHHPDDFYHDFILKREAIIAPDPLLKNEAATALNQTFFFCGQGREMTAYESADHRLVIKFFNQPTLVRRKWFLDWNRVRKLCSLRWFYNTYFKDKSKLTHLFDRYQMVFNELHEESGILYVHLNRSTALSQVVHLIDEKGQKHFINAEKAPFILQQKVELPFARFRSLQKQGNLEKLEESIAQLYDLFLSRAKKGFTDRIQNWHSNFGFAENRAIQIDFGRIIKDETILQRLPEEMQRIFLQAREHYPELSTPIQKVLEKKQ